MIEPSEEGKHGAPAIGFKWFGGRGNEKAGLTSNTRGPDTTGPLETRESIWNGKSCTRAHRNCQSRERKTGMTSAANGPHLQACLAMTRGLRLM